MIAASVFWMLFTDPGNVLSTALAASASGVQLALTLVAIYIVWMGIVQVAIDAGLVDALAKLMEPVIRWLFGKQSKEVNGLIATNISANMIGAGAAATPAAISAIEKMAKPGQTQASTAMIMLFILSATSMQILPTTVIGILEKNGAANASNVILPTFVVSTVTTLIGVILVKIFGATRRVSKTTPPPAEAPRGTHPPSASPPPPFVRGETSMHLNAAEDSPLAKRGDALAAGGAKSRDAEEGDPKS